MMTRFAAIVVSAGLGMGVLAAHVQEIHGDPRAPVVATVLGMKIHTQDADDVRYLVLKRLTDRYAHDKGITVTQTEKEAYVERMAERMHQDRIIAQRRRDALIRRLEADGLTAAERKSLTVKLDDANRFLAALAEPSGSADEIRAARLQIATAFIRQWKLNRALYQQYGGRIIYQQGGPEPLDAYRRFLEERQARGDFTLYDESVATRFWRYYRTDAIHSFYAPGSEDEARAFGSPPWQPK